MLASGIAVSPPLDLRYSLIHAVLASVRDAGGDADAVARRCRITVGDAIPPRLPDEVELWEQAAAEVRDPFFGVHVAQRIQRGLFGALEFLCRSAPTLGDAIDTVVKYLPMIQPDMRMATAVVDDETIVEGQLLCAVRCARQVDEFFCTLVLLGARILSRTRLLPSRVWFAHPEPADTSELRELFGKATFEFGRPTSGFAVAARARLLPVVSADPPLHAVLERAVSTTIAARTPGEPPRSDGDTVARARRLVAATLYQRAPRTDWIARTLGVSARTLQRQLAAERSSVRELVDGVRRELACAYVADPARALGEIPYLVGYADARQFFRSFKRWTGVTPSAYRAQRAPTVGVARNAARLADAAIGAAARSR